MARRSIHNIVLVSVCVTTTTHTHEPARIQRAEFQLAPLRALYTASFNSSLGGWHHFLIV